MIRNATGDVLKRVPAELQGMQQVRLPMRAQGDLTLSLDGESSSYRMPYSVGSGRQLSRPQPKNTRQRATLTGYFISRPTCARSSPVQRHRVTLCYKIGFNWQFRHQSGVYLGSRRASRPRTQSARR